MKLRIGLLVFCLLLVNLVSAGMLVSDAGVKYDSDLLRVFDDKGYALWLISDEDFTGLKIIDDQVWARVNVILKDQSEIIIEGTKEERRDLVNKRIKWFINFNRLPVELRINEHRFF